MKFLFILTQIEENWAKAPPGEGERVYQQYMELEEELKQRGKLIESVRLRPRNEAKTFQNLPNGKRRLIDGPFVENKEAIGGLYVLNCASFDEALEWAKRMPNYGHGSIEIRPFWE
jgi:hypothetical protein